jgi:hypothetical protein
MRSTRVTDARFLQPSGLGTWGYGLLIRFFNVSWRESITFEDTGFNSSVAMCIVGIRVGREFWGLKFEEVEVQGEDDCTSTAPPCIAVS